MKKDCTDRAVEMSRSLTKSANLLCTSTFPLASAAGEKFFFQNGSCIGVVGSGSCSSLGLFTKKAFYCSTSNVQYSGKVPQQETASGRDPVEKKPKKGKLIRKKLKPVTTDTNQKVEDRSITLHNVLMNRHASGSGSYTVALL